jgi:hypothetical protein
MSIEAMKQALEALNQIKNANIKGLYLLPDFHNAITALRQAIEQAEKQEKLCNYCGGIGRVVCDGRCLPEQEPVAWSGDCVLGHCGSPDGCDRSGCCRADTAPPKPEQEPVAWMSQGGDVSRSKKHFEEMGFNFVIPLYTAPFNWVGIAVDEIPSLWGNADADLWLFAQAIETKLRERNNG